MKIEDIKRIEPQVEVEGYITPFEQCQNFIAYVDIYVTFVVLFICLCIFSNNKYKNKENGKLIKSLFVFSVINCILMSLYIIQNNKNNDLTKL